MRNFGRKSSGASGVIYFVFVPVNYIENQERGAISSCVNNWEDEYGWVTRGTFKFQKFIEIILVIFVLVKS